MDWPWIYQYEGVMMLNKFIIGKSPSTMWDTNHRFPFTPPQATFWWKKIIPYWKEALKPKMINHAKFTFKDYFFPMYTITFSLFSKASKKLLDKVSEIVAFTLVVLCLSSSGIVENNLRMINVNPVALYLVENTKAASSFIFKVFTQIFSTW